MNRNNNSPRRSYGPVASARRAGSALVGQTRANHAEFMRAANAVSAFAGRNMNSPVDRERLRRLIRLLAGYIHISGIALSTWLVQHFVRTRPATAAAIVAAMWGREYVVDRTGSVIRRARRRAAGYVRNLPGRAARTVGAGARSVAARVGRVFRRRSPRNN